MKNLFSILLLSSLFLSKAYAFSSYININSSFTDEGSIYSLDLENNFNLSENIFLSGGLVSYYSFEDMDQFNNKRIFNNSLYLGAKYRFLNIKRNKKTIRSVKLKNNKIIIKDTTENINHNNENGVYLGFNRHYNAFNNGESAYSNEYLIQYEFKKYIFNQRLKVGYKYNDLQKNDRVKFNLHSITIGISFE